MGRAPLGSPPANRQRNGEVTVSGIGDRVASLLFISRGQAYCVDALQRSTRRATAHFAGVAGPELYARLAGTYLFFPILRLPKWNLATAGLPPRC